MVGERAFLVHKEPVLTPGMSTYLKTGKQEIFQDTYAAANKFKLRLAKTNYKGLLLAEMSLLAASVGMTIYI